MAVEGLAHLSCPGSSLLAPQILLPALGPEKWGQGPYYCAFLGLKQKQKVFFFPLKALFFGSFFGEVAPNRV